MGSFQVGMLVLIAIITQFANIKAANILAILTTPTRSHHYWNTPLMLSLASRGHHVTIVSPVALKVPVPNITDIVLEGSLDFTNEEADYASMTKATILEKLSIVKDWYLFSCQYSLSTNGARTLMEYTKNTTFDLYIIEASGGECFFGFLHKFGKAPIVAVNGFGSPEWINYNIGSPYNPSYITSSFLSYDYPSGLWQRIQNTLLYSAAMFFYHYSYLPSHDALIHKHFGEGVPPVKETLNNVSVLLVSYHHSFNGPRPLVPAMIPVGGIHIKKPKPLPKDLQTYLDDAKDGVIFFSLGSIVRSDRMSPDRIQLFLEAFAELPQKVLWKWESDSLPGQPKNVKLGKWLPQNDILALSRQYFGLSAPLPTKILQNISMVLASTHPAFDYPRPQVPSLVSVAGVHIKNPEPLPNDIRKFLDEAREGVILFSLGSNLECDIMAEDKQRAFLEAFSELHQKVLWKCTAESTNGQSTNVKLTKWLPQSDILAHPNVRLLITHAGLLSTQEAIHHGVPVVGIPFYADQYINIHKMVDHGVGVKLEYEDITKENVLKAISTVINDPRYSINMRELSARFRDQPETPLERAVFWCEYVLRHKGALHLRSAAVDLTWYQYLLLDVILLILVMSFIPVSLLYCCCKLIFRKQKVIMKQKRS